MTIRFSHIKGINILENSARYSELESQIKDVIMLDSIENYEDTLKRLKLDIFSNIIIEKTYSKYFSKREENQKLLEISISSRSNQENELLSNSVNLSKDVLLKTNNIRGFIATHLDIIKEDKLFRYWYKNSFRTWYFIEYHKDLLGHEDETIFGDIDDTDRNTVSKKLIGQKLTQPYKKQLDKLVGDLILPILKLIVFDIDFIELKSEKYKVFRNEYRIKDTELEESLKTDNLKSKLRSFPIGRLVETYKDYFMKDVFFKYEEDIETLPKSYKVENCWTSTEDVGLKLGDTTNFSVKNLIETNLPYLFEKIEIADTQATANIILTRHQSNFNTAENNRIVYLESLSGSQNYFTLLESNLDEYSICKLFLQIVQMSLLDIGIIDERCFEYYVKNDKNEPEKDNYQAANIHIFSPETHKGFEFNAKEIFDVVLTDVIPDPLKNLDFLIIHQSFLEKKYKLKDDRLNIVSNLKDRGINVILTTGRGKQSDDFKDYAYLSFTEVRESLLKGHPEKVMLVNSIFKSLNGIG